MMAEPVRWLGMALAALLLLGGCSATVAGLLASCAAVRPQPDTLPGAVTVTYRTASHRALRLYLFRPATPRPSRAAVLFFFGGAWTTGSVASFEDQAAAFARAGYLAVLADYRVKCRDGTTPLASVEDARVAYDWLRGHAASFGADPAHVVLAGGSAGGQLALVTAIKAATKPAALLLFNPAVDLVTPAPWYLKPFARAVSPSVLSVDTVPPMLIVHGEADHRVPIASVRAFCTRVVAAGRTCVLQAYAGADHGFYHSHAVDPAIGRPPYDDTLDRALRFAEAQGL